MKKIKVPPLMVPAQPVPANGLVLSTRNLLNRVADTCAINGCDPFEILCRIAMGDVEYLGWQDSAKPISMTVRMEAAATLCPYLAPTFKNAEIKEEGKRINVNFFMGERPHGS